MDESDLDVVDRRRCCRLCDGMLLRRRSIGVGVGVMGVVIVSVRRRSQVQVEGYRQRTLRRTDVRIPQEVDVKPRETRELFTRRERKKLR